MPRFLIIGSGYVAGPVLAHLAKNALTHITLAGVEPEQMRKLVEAEGLAMSPRVDTTVLDVQTCSDAELDPIVKAHDVIISLVPATMHMPVARACLRTRRHLVTASYVSDEMRALDMAAKEAGITLASEMGLDPGIDHMSAVDLVTRLHAEGKRVTSFESACGALPAPEAALSNPLRYKFSWSPAGVLRAAKNSARWLEGGDVEEVSGGALLNAYSRFTMAPCFSFDALPNRDSLKYIDLYGLHVEHKDAALQTFRRLTLRYPGFCEAMALFQRLGLLSEERLDPALTFCSLRTWRNLIKTQLQLPVAPTADAFEAIARAEAMQAPALRPSSVAATLAWINLCDDTLIPDTCKTPLDALCARLGPVMGYAEGECDAVYLMHRVVYVWDDADGSKRVGNIEMMLLERGDARHSAVARTVGAPAAIAAELLAQGTISERGVIVPSAPALAALMLEHLERAGIRMHETRRE